MLKIMRKIIATSKLYGHDELHIPKKVIKEYTATEISQDTIFDWSIKDNKIILTPRKKVSIEDVKYD